MKEILTLKFIWALSSAPRFSAANDTSLIVLSMHVNTAVRIRTDAALVARSRSVIGLFIPDNERLQPLARDLLKWARSDDHKRKPDETP